MDVKFSKKDPTPFGTKSHRARNQSVLEPELKGKECTTSMESERGQEAAQKTLSHTPWKSSDGADRVNCWFSLPKSSFWFLLSLSL